MVDNQRAPVGFDMRLLCHKNVLKSKGNLSAKRNPSGLVAGASPGRPKGRKRRHQTLYDVKIGS